MCDAVLSPKWKHHFCSYLQPTCLLLVFCTQCIWTSTDFTKRAPACRTCDFWNKLTPDMYGLYYGSLRVVALYQWTGAGCLRWYLESQGLFHKPQKQNIKLSTESRDIKCVVSECCVKIALKTEMSHVRWMNVLYGLNGFLLMFPLFKMWIASHLRFLSSQWSSQCTSRFLQIDHSVLTVKVFIQH